MADAKNPGGGAVGPAGTLWGKCVFVDIINGDDATGTRGNSGRPFLTVNAAVAAALDGDTIIIRPGTYDITPFTMPENVTIWGVGGPNNVILRALSVTANTTLITMANGSRIQNCLVRLTSDEHHTLTAIRFPGSTAASARVLDCGVEVENGGAPSGGSSDVKAFDIDATANEKNFECLQRVRIMVVSTGEGTKDGVHGQAGGRILLQNLAVRVEKQGGGTAEYNGIRTTAASTVLLVKNGVIDGDTEGGSGSTHHDINQENGSIVLEDTELVNNDAADRGFSAPYSAYGETWLGEGTIAPGVTRFLSPGSAPPSADEIVRGAERPIIIFGMRVKARVASGGGNSTTYTLRKNGVDTGIAVTISGGTTTAAFTGNVSVSYAPGDDYSIKQEESGTSNAEDVAVTLEIY